MDELSSLLGGFDAMKYFEDFKELGVLTAGALAGGYTYKVLADYALSMADAGTKIPAWGLPVAGTVLGTLFAGAGLAGRIGSMSLGRMVSRASIGVGIGMLANAVPDYFRAFGKDVPKVLQGLGASDSMLLGSPADDLYNRYLGAPPVFVENVSGMGSSPAPTTVEQVAGMGAAPTTAMTTSNDVITRGMSGGVGAFYPTALPSMRGVIN
jgi:hypothetical protein